MKKYLIVLLLAFSMLLPNPILFADRGGSSFAGGMAGGMLGGMISGAMTKDSSGREAKRDVDQLRREQQQAKVAELRREMYGQKTGFITFIMIIAFIIMFLSILGLLFMVLKTRGRKRG